MKDKYAKKELFELLKETKDKVSSSLEILRQNFGSIHNSQIA